MKMILFIASLITCSVALGQSTDAGIGPFALDGASLAKKPKAQLTPEQLVARRQYLMQKRFGGFVYTKQPGSGKFVFVNAQKKVPSSAWSLQYPIISDAFSVELSEATSDVEVTVKNAKDAIKAAGGNAGVILIDNPDYPAVLVAPECGWGLLNVHALSIDKPSPELLARRVRREIWRAFAMTAGSTDTEWDRCLLGPITSLRDLDDIQSEAVSPEPASKIKKHLTKLGIKPYTRVTYKQACIEGWAPTPSNDFQRVIWERVKSDKERGPTNPITIQPPKAKK